MIDARVSTDRRQPVATWLLALAMVSALCIPITGLPAAQRAKDENNDAAWLHAAQYELLNLIRHDVFSAPAASRVYTYASLACYETLRLNAPGYPSIAGRLNGFDSLPYISQKIAYDHVLAALVAFWKTAEALVFSDDTVALRLQQLLQQWSEHYGASTTEGSLHVGTIMADWMLKRAAADGFAEIRKMKRYQVRQGDGNWTPTPPDYAEALEPHWGKLLPLALSHAAQFRPARPPAYSTKPDSEFMQEVREVLTATQRLDSVNRLIALYWDDNPSTTMLSGHITYTIKKFSPGAHWLLIARQVLRQTRADVYYSALTYAAVSVAVFDGFISCWEEKYYSERLRPITVIQRWFDAGWQPLIQTPPFPEYTSGHSVVSAAAATVLQVLFGESFAFTDSVEVMFGMPPRYFGSFAAAAEEASESRFYGGIHFRSALTAGRQQGRLVGQQVIGRFGL